MATGLSMSRFRLRYLDHEVAVSPGGFLIGRSPDCDFRLGGTHVSRRHALLRAAAQGVTIEDLGSRNGVLVNGRPVHEPVLLAHGDEIMIGGDTMTILDEEFIPPPASVITVRPPPAAPPTLDRDAEEAHAETAVSSPRCSTPGCDAPLDALTRREYEVFTLLAQGLTHREIAQRLFVSVKTIETHRTRIGEKLGTRNVRKVMHCAIAGGVLRLPVAR